MHHHHNNQRSNIDMNLFVPGLSVFEGVAEGIISGCGRIAGLVSVAVEGLRRLIR